MFNVCILETNLQILRSTEMFLDPPDVEVLMDPPTPVKARDKANILLQCNVTSGNPSDLSKVSQ